MNVHAGKGETSLLKSCNLTLLNVHDTHLHIVG